MNVKEIISHSKYYIIVSIISIAIGISGTLYFVSKGSDRSIKDLQGTITNQSGTIEQLRSENSKLTISRDNFEQSNKQFEQINSRLRATISDLQKSGGTIINTTGELRKDIQDIKGRESSAIDTITKLIIKSESNGVSK